MKPILARIVCLLMVVLVVFAGAGFWMSPIAQVIFAIPFGILGLGLSEHLFRILTRSNEKASPSDKHRE
jgi:predicted membrane chloride channel (bestrophin family)